MVAESVQMAAKCPEVSKFSVLSRLTRWRTIFLTDRNELFIDYKLPLIKCSDVLVSLEIGFLKYYILVPVRSNQFHAEEHP